MIKPIGEDMEEKKENGGQTIFVWEVIKRTALLWVCTLGVMIGLICDLILLGISTILEKQSDDEYQKWAKSENQKQNRRRKYEKTCCEFIFFVDNGAN